MPEQIEHPASARSDERRRLLRGGLAAGPVLMTIASRPVFGQTNCGSAQIQASLAAGTSLNVTCRSAIISTGKLPTYWSGNVTWPSGFQQNGSSATLFHSTATGFSGSVFGTYTIQKVLKLQAGGGTYQIFGEYIAAALLNAQSGKTPFLSAATVTKMWNDNLTLGYYEVSPGINWTQAQILAYLQSTMA